MSKEKTLQRKNSKVSSDGDSTPEMNRSQPLGGKLKKLFGMSRGSKVDVSSSSPSLDVPSSSNSHSNLSSSGSHSNSNSNLQVSEEEKGRWDEFLATVKSGELSMGPSLSLPASFSWNKEFLSQLLRTLRSVAAIERLSLPDLTFESDTFAALAEGLAGNWSLKTIDFTRVTKFSDKNFEDFLKGTITITKVEIVENRLSQEVRDSMVKLLEENAGFQKVLSGERTRLVINRRNVRDMDHILPLLKPTLAFLNLSNNNISTLTDQHMELLVGLEELLLSNNQLRTLPQGLGQLAKLRKLNVSGNKLANLPPDAICRLTSLVSLDIGGNKLSDLFSLVNLPKSLKTLIAFGNPLSLPNEVLDEGERLIPYLRTFQSGVKQCYRIKLMIVGGEKSGKTSVAYALMGKKMKKTTCTAEGVDINDWIVKTTVGQVELSIWDFSGSDYYNQFFIAQRALYVIVFRLTDTKDDLLLWLQTIESRAKESLVVIVGTHMDKVEKKKIQTTLAELKSKYSTFENVIDYVAVSGKTLKGIEELRLLLLDAVLNSMPHLPETVPETYRRLEETLKKIRDQCRAINEPPIKTLAEYTTIAGGCNIAGEEVGLSAAYLTNVGVIAYYRRVTAKEYIVLDPRWIINMFSAIVANKDAYIKQGLLDIRDLRTSIWKPPMYPEFLHDFMIALLQKFELVYKLPEVSKFKATYLQNGFTREAEAKGARGFLAFASDEKEEETDTSSGTLLFPSMLEDFTKEEFEQKVNAHWPAKVPPGQHELGRNYHFNFLPLGLVSRVVARFLNTSGWEPLVYWKNGILMVRSAGKQSAEDSSRDMMLLSGKPYYLTFNVRGKNPGMHLVNLAESIETLVMDSLRIPVRISVTCTHCMREGSAHPFFFPLIECERAIAEGNGIVLCNYRRQVNVSDIAPDIALSGVIDLPHIPPTEIDFGKQIGEGAFAKVFLGTYAGEDVAIKKLELGGTTQQPGEATPTISTSNQGVLDVFTDFRREVLLMSSLRHKNIVALKGVVMDPFCIVMELMGNGSLFDLIHDKEKEIDSGLAVSLARDIAEAMHFLHGIPLVHRDLKSPNILLTTDKNTGRLIAKVADFGLSRKVLLTPSLKGKVVDNPVWLAPEAIRGEAFSFASDVYAFGVILWELFSREKFFGHLRFTFQIEDAVLNGERPDIPDTNCPADCVNLIVESWDGDPTKRPAFDKIIERLSKVESKLKLLAAKKKKIEEEEERGKREAAAAAAAKQ